MSQMHCSNSTVRALPSTPCFNQMHTALNPIDFVAKHRHSFLCIARHQLWPSSVRQSVCLSHAATQCEIRPWYNWSLIKIVHADIRPNWQQNQRSCMTSNGHYALCVFYLCLLSTSVIHTGNKRPSASLGFSSKDEQMTTFGYQTLDFRIGCSCSRGFKTTYSSADICYYLSVQERVQLRS